MPSSSSFCAMMSLSSTEKETASPCVPSRRVVSKVKIFIKIERGQAWRPAALRYGYAYFFFLLEEGHHFAEFAAHFFHGLVLGGGAHGEELVAAGFVFVDPLAGEFAGLDFGQDALHFGAG